MRNAFVSLHNIPSYSGGDADRDAAPEPVSASLATLTDGEKFAPKFDPPAALKILMIYDSDSDAEAFLFRQTVDEIDDKDVKLDHCTDYAGGLSAIQSGTYDIAFVDYYLGHQTGAELIEAAGGRLSPTPLVLLTGWSGHDTERHALAAGAVDFVEKNSLSPQLLRRVIRYARYNHNTARELAISQERYRELAETAVEANSQKSRFFAEMSHELRTPLNAIIGFSEMMKQQLHGRLEGAGSQHYLDYAADIFASSQHLLSLINDLLDLSKLEAGEYQVNLELVTVDRITGDLLKMTAPLAETAGIDLKVVLADNLPQVVVDPRLILQALLNVVSNAIKFTGDGGTVRVEAKVEGRSVLLLVRDTGCGIAAGEIETVLLPYRQGSAMETRPGGGTGLGLTLTKSIMELHRGDIVIESEQGTGTSVTLQLPLNLPLFAGSD